MTQKKKTDFKIVTPPDDLSEVRAKTKKIHREKLKKIVVPVILIALAVSGTYLMLTNKAYSEAGTAVRYSTDSSDTSNYAHFANGIVRYNRDGVVFLNKKNEEKWIQSTQLKNPIIEVKEKAFAVGDIGGNSILVFSEEGLKGEIETSLPIENMAISDQGIVTVLLKNETAPKIISYDAMGNVLVEQQVTVPVMGYPVAMDMSDDGKMLAVTYLHTDDAVLKSKVIYYNFGESGKDKPDKIVASDEYSDTIMADVFFMGSDRSVVVGDNSIVIYKGKSEPKKEKEISIGQEIQSVFHSDKYIGLILFNSDKSGYELRLYDRFGERILNKEISGRYGNAKIEGSEVIMYEGSKCCIVTANGIVKFEGDIKTEALEIFKASGLNRYYVMSADELRVIYLTK